MSFWNVSIIDRKEKNNANSPGSSDGTVRREYTTRALYDPNEIERVL